MSTTVTPALASVPAEGHEGPNPSSNGVTSRDTEKLNARSQKQSSLHSEKAALDKIRVEVQQFRTKQQWIAYLVMAVSLFCTIGTAIIGLAAAVLSFNDQPIASKVVSLTLATFGVALSLLKGIGQPANAFMDIIEANHIIDDIDDYCDPPSTKNYDDIKAAWRRLRDNTIATRATVWKNLQK